MAQGLDGEAVREEFSARPEAHLKEEDGPITKFAELAERNLVAKNVVDTLTKGMGLETMTEVQALTIEKSLKGGDMYVKASLFNAWSLEF